MKPKRVSGKGRRPDCARGAFMGMEGWKAGYQEELNRVAAVRAALAARAVLDEALTAQKKAARAAEKAWTALAKARAVLNDTTETRR